MADTILKPTTKNFDTFLETCDECNNYIILDSKNGHYVCTNCGSVPDIPFLDYKVVPKLDKENKLRLLNRSFSGKSTFIGEQENVNPGQKYRNWRLKMFDNQISSEDVAYKLGYNEIMRLASQLDVPEKIRWNAFDLFRKVHKDKLMVGRSIDAFSAASLYYVCRNYRYIITFDEIEPYTGLTSQKIYRTYKLLACKYGKLSPFKPAEFLSRIISFIPYRIGKKELTDDQKTEMTDKISTYATELLVNYEKDPESSDPKGLATAAVYMAVKKYGKEFGVKITQTEVSDIGDITEVTLRKSVKILDKCS